MQSKLIEIRDRATKLYMIATQMRSDELAEHRILKNAGYSDTCPLVLLGRIEDSTEAHYDPFEWRYEGMVDAHRFIQDNWELVADNWTIDSETLRGDKPDAKVPDRYYGQNTITFEIKDMIELSDYDATKNILVDMYGLEIVEDYGKQIELDRSSVEDCGMKFLEVLRDYLKVIQ